ncbi:MAG: chorismate mutase [Crenarchaeota archaeon]|nr:chorismate mutase [Thermoproteota archaeon]
MGEEVRRELAELRRKIDRIDETILRLIKKRAELAREIAREKITIGLSIIDREREETVRRRWIERAENLELPREVIEPVLDAVMKYAIMMQVAETVGRKWKDKIEITIIGAGGMGKTMYKLFTTFGIRTTVLSAREIAEKENIELPQGRVLIFATRPEFFREKTFLKVLDSARAGTVVMDVLSVKERTFNMIDRECAKRDLEYISAHPLFGPTILVLGENIILIRGESCKEETFTLIRNLFSDMGLHVIVLDSAETHDRYMSVIQVLHHFHQLSLMKSLEKCSREEGIDVRKLCTKSLRMTLKVLDRLRDVMRAVIEIQLYNKYARDMRKISIENMKRLAECLDSSGEDIDKAMKCVEAE